jgi:hypothetical protein
LELNLPKSADNRLAETRRLGTREEPVTPYYDAAEKKYVVDHTIEIASGRVIAKVYGMDFAEGNPRRSQKFLASTFLSDLAELRSKHKLNAPAMLLLMSIRAHCDMRRGDSENISFMGAAIGLDSQATTRATKRLRETGLISTKQIGLGKKLSVSCHWGKSYSRQ